MPTTQRETVLAFDFDGVISDSMAVQDRCWQHSVEAVLGQSAIEEMRQIRRNLYEGRAGEEMFAGLKVGDRVKRALRINKDRMWDEASFRTPLVRGAAATLRKIAEYYRIAIATTAKRIYVEHLLRTSGIFDLFGIIVTDADVTFPKPAPDMLQKISAHFQTPLSDICMIGDSASDCEMAVRAGARFIWFKPSDVSPPLPASKTVRSWKELADFFDIS